MALAIAMLIGYIPMFFWAVSELRPPKKRKITNRYEDSAEQTPWKDPER